MDKYADLVTKCIECEPAGVSYLPRTQCSTHVQGPLSIKGDRSQQGSAYGSVLMAARRSSQRSAPLLRHGSRAPSPTRPDVPSQLAGAASGIPAAACSTSVGSTAACSAAAGSAPVAAAATVQPQAGAAGDGGASSVRRRTVRVQAVQAAGMHLDEDFPYVHGCWRARPSTHLWVEWQRPGTLRVRRSLAL
eukprot:1306138-Amphidinium_carterae.1